ncbi:MAG: hypothetical protein ACHP7D_04590 [Lysobacterales bacterium]
MLARVRHAGPALVVRAGVIACLFGLVLERMAAALPWARFGDSLVLATFAPALAAALRHWRGALRVDAAGTAELWSLPDATPSAAKVPR